MISEFHSLLRAHNTAFRSGDWAQYSTTRTELKRGITAAKETYKRRIESHLTDNEHQRMWQGIQHLISDTSSSVEADPSLAEKQNCYFAHFEVDLPAGSPLPPPDSKTTTLILQGHEVRCVLRSVNPRKAAVPDGVPSKVLKECADQLSGIFTKLFQHLPVTGHYSYLLKVNHHHPHPKTVRIIQT